MSVLSKMLIAGTVVTVLGGAAYAAGEPWVLRNDMVYTVDSTGKPVIVTLDTMKKDSMAKAKAVPNGTVFFMQDGHLMMMDASINR